MIRKLRLKFVLINMSVVTIMMAAVFGLIFTFTSANLERESIHMMQDIAGQPFQLEAPDQLAENVRLPFFTLQVDPGGTLLKAGGGYYDLSNREFLDSLVRTCLIIGVISFFGFLWASILLSKWAVRPVEQAWKEQRQFIAAASHELKTPLTVIMTNAQLMSSPGCDEQKHAKFRDSILVMSRQMKKLTEQMLELARSESAEPGLAFAPVDWSGLVSRTVLPFESVFFEKGMELKVEVEEKIQVIGEQAQLHQVVEILLDNAQKYASPGALSAYGGKPGRGDRPGRSDSAVPAVLSGGPGPRPQRQFWAGAFHCPERGDPPPGPHLGPEPGRGKPIYGGAALQGIKRKEKKAVCPKGRLLFFVRKTKLSAPFQLA